MKSKTLVMGFFVKSRTVVDWDFGKRRTSSG